MWSDTRETTVNAVVKAPAGCEGQRVSSEQTKEKVCECRTEDLGCSGAGGALSPVLAVPLGHQVGHTSEVG